MKILRSVALAVTVLLACTGVSYAQAATTVSLTTPQYTLIPISSTAAVNNATTLTIPAPAGGQYNYVCYLAWEVGQDGTAGTAQSNSATTSTNFNSFALKFSLAATASVDTGSMVVIPFNGGLAGCPKSSAPGTATTFVGPVANLHAAQTWYAIYYQAP